MNKTNNNTQQQARLKLQFRTISYVCRRLQRVVLRPGEIKSIKYWDRWWAYQNTSKRCVCFRPINAIDDDYELALALQEPQQHTLVSFTNSPTYRCNFFLNHFRHFQNESDVEASCSLPWEQFRSAQARTYPHTDGQEDLGSQVHTSSQ